jgi:hypothetical protein
MNKKEIEAKMLDVLTARNKAEAVVKQCEAQAKAQQKIADTNNGAYLALEEIYRSMPADAPEETKAETEGEKKPLEKVD